MKCSILTDYVVAWYDKEKSKRKSRWCFDGPEICLSVGVWRAEWNSLSLFFILNQSLFNKENPVNIVKCWNACTCLTMKSVKSMKVLYVLFLIVPLALDAYIQWKDKTREILLACGWMCYDVSCFLCGLIHLFSCLFIFFHAWNFFHFVSKHLCIHYFVTIKAHILQTFCCSHFYIWCLRRVKETLVDSLRSGN